MVRLVEDEGADLAKVKVLAVGEVEQPPGGANHDVRSGLERVDLRLIGAAAVDGEHARAEPLACLLEVVGDLNGQFPGGYHDETGGLLGRPRGGDRGRQPVQHGHAECQRLAGAGARLPDDVLAVDGQRQRQRLNGKGRVDARVVQRGANRFVDTEVAERHRVRRPGCRGAGWCLVAGLGIGWLSCQGFLRARITRARA